MRAFWMLKILKSGVRYCKIKVLRVQEKYKKMIKNGSQNGSQNNEKWSPWRPKGGQGATLPPPGSILKGSENRSFFERHPGGQKVDGR